MIIFILLFKTIIDIYIITFILRIWMQKVKCDFYHPLSQFIIRITQPLIVQIRKIIPFIQYSYHISCCIVLFLSIVKYPIINFMQTKHFTYNIIYLILGILVCLKSIGDLLFWIIIIRSLLTWMYNNNNYSNSIALICFQLSEPFLYYIRKCLPKTNDIDISATLVIMILYLFNNIRNSYVSQNMASIIDYV